MDEPSLVLGTTHLHHFATALLCVLRGLLFVFCLDALLGFVGRVECFHAHVPPLSLFPCP